MKQSLCQHAHDSQPRVVNRPHFEAWIRPESEITSPNLAFMFKPDLGPKAKFTEQVKIYTTAGYRQHSKVNMTK